MGGEVAGASRPVESETVRLVVCVCWHVNMIQMPWPRLAALRKGRIVTEAAVYERIEEVDMNRFVRSEAESRAPHVVTVQEACPYWSSCTGMRQR